MAKKLGSRLPFKAIFQDKNSLNFANWQSFGCFCFLLTMPFVQNPNPNHHPVFNPLDISNAKPYKPRIVKNPKPYTLPDFSKVEAKQHKPQPTAIGIEAKPYVPEPIRAIKPERLDLALNYFISEFPGARICVTNGFVEVFDAVEPPPPLNPHEAVPVPRDSFSVEVIFNGKRKTFTISPPRPKRSHKKKMA